jgi:hypothetical protein
MLGRELRDTSVSYVGLSCTLYYCSCYSLKLLQITYLCLLLQSVTGTEHIYLGPHGAPPQYGGRAGQDNSTPNRKQRLKQKLKDAERKTSASSRENKVEVLQDLMGGKPGAGPSPRGAESEWLDPYCHESQFERPANRA